MVTYLFYLFQVTGTGSAYYPVNQLLSLGASCLAQLTLGMFSASNTLLFWFGCEVVHV